MLKNELTAAIDRQNWQRGSKYAQPANSHAHTHFYPPPPTYTHSYSFTHTYMASISISRINSFSIFNWIRKRVNWLSTAAVAAAKGACRSVWKEPGVWQSLAKIAIQVSNQMSHETCESKGGRERGQWSVATDFVARAILMTFRKCLHSQFSPSGCGKGGEEGVRGMPKCWLYLKSNMHSAFSTGNHNNSNNSNSYGSLAS